MKHFVVGADGVLGRAIVTLLELRGQEVSVSTRRHDRPEDDLGHPSVKIDLLRVAAGEQFATPPCDVAYLCAGTKGFAECEGNRDAFRADVDGVLGLARHLLSLDVNLVYISSDGVEWGANTGYARNRLLVEMALVMNHKATIIRPGKFTVHTAPDLARLCIDMAGQAGLHYWRARRVPAEAAA